MAMSEQDLSKIRCQKCGAMGVTEEGMDVFIACLCQLCFDRIWKEYTQVMTKGPSMLDFTGFNTMSYQLQDNGKQVVLDYRLAPAVSIRVALGQDAVKDILEKIQQAEQEQEQEQRRA